MSHKSHKKHNPYCLNCHYPLSEFDKNCSQCGQKPTDGKITLHDLLHEFVHTLFHLDGKFFWTLKHLFVPGKLTTEFFKGHHKRYAHPVQLFLVLGALAFSTIISKTYKAEEEINKSIERTKEKIYRQYMLEELKKTHLALAPQYSADQRRILDTAFISFKNTDFSKKNLKAENIEVKEIGLKINFSNSKEKSTVNIDSIVKIEVENELKNEKEYQNNNVADDFMQGFNNAKADRKYKIYGEVVEKRIKGEVNDALKNLKNNKLYDPYYIRKDSSKLFNFINIGTREGYENIKIPDEEFFTLDADSILEKYKIEGFWNKLDATQNIKVNRDGGSLFHQYMGKLIWVTLFLIPVLALVFLLLYRRQKRYYVEHIVFLLHINTTFFVGLVLMFWIFPIWQGIAVLFFIWAPIHFFLSLKFYYQQGKRKTFLKYSIIAFFYFVLAMLGLVLSLIISFFLF